MKNDYSYLGLGLAIGFLAIVLVVTMVPVRHAAPVNHPTVGSERRQVALDCSRPQGHHRWVADMISPPSSPKDGTVMRLSTRDQDGNSDVTEIDIEGWLCVIDAEYPKVR